MYMQGAADHMVPKFMSANVSSNQDEHNDEEMSGEDDNGELGYHRKLT